MRRGTQADEMMPNETAEQFEERVRNKRSNVLLRYLSKELGDEDAGLAFSAIVVNNNRKQVCSLLALPLPSPLTSSSSSLTLSRIRWRKSSTRFWC